MPSDITQESNLIMYYMIKICKTAGLTNFAH